MAQSIIQTVQQPETRVQRRYAADSQVTGHIWIVAGMVSDANEIGYPKKKTALLVRNGELEQVENLISEIGLFTVHLDGQFVGEDHGYSGYLVRSKSAGTTEGGVHSGMGVLDSLVIENGPLSQSRN